MIKVTFTGKIAARFGQVFKAGMIAFLLITGTQNAFSQNGVGISTTNATADASAMLDVVSTSKGALLPRMTESQRTGISSPATGLIVYQTDGTIGYYYNGGTPGSPVWERFADDNGSVVTSVTGTSPIISSGGTTPAISLGTVPIANGGTGQTTANTALNALLPSQSGNSGKYLTSNGSSSSWASAGVLIGYRLLTSTTSATYTPTTGTTSIIVEAVGGGGGGGGATFVGTPWTAASGGGGSGAYTRKFISSVAASYTYQVGAGGGSGSAGANTTFGSSVVTANGGAAGNPATAASVTTATAGGTGGTAGATGDINIPGCKGGSGVSFTAGGVYSLGIAGTGGSSHFGGGGPGAVGGASVSGTAGALYGGGGGGAVAVASSTSGGAGANGVIIVWEFK